MTGVWRHGDIRYGEMDGHPDAQQRAGVPVIASLAFLSWMPIVAVLAWLIGG